MNVLFKTEYGSRLYGTNTPTSDTDWKVVYLPALDDLLVGKRLSITSKSTGDDKSRNTSDDEDISFIPLQIFAKDFLAGQTYAIEVAFAYLSRYDSTGLFGYFVGELTSRFLTSNVKAMVGYALNQAQIYGVKGTRLATVEKFKEHLETLCADGFADEKLDLVENWLSENTDKYLFYTTYENHNEKLAAVSLLEKVYPFNITVGEAYNRVRKLEDKYGVRAQAAKQADGADWKAMSHALRILMQAIVLLEEHKLVFPLPADAVAFLKSVKNGKVPFENVQTVLVNWMHDLDVAKENTTLPANTDDLEQEFNTWLIKWVRLFYTEYTW